MVKYKNIILRAFSLVNTDLKHNETNLLSLLSFKLKDSVMNDRRMLINPDDPQREEDLIANFDLRMKRKVCVMVVGTMLRIASVDDMPNITDDILNKEKVDIETLESINAPKKDVCPQSGEKIDETNSDKSNTTNIDDKYNDNKNSSSQLTTEETIKNLF